MKIVNTMTSRLEDVVPIEPGHIRMYTCGPTIYDFAHIGNYRTYVFEDLLRRTLKYAGFRVTQVMNLTDVDDKTIAGATRSGLALGDYTRKFRDAFFEDIASLNIEPAEHYPAATGHIPEMIRLISALLERGFAYRSEDGSVYFSVRKFPAYGKLTHPDMSGLKAGARVSQDEYEKESVGDFALWKAWDAADGNVAWEAPWGRGRPGWHIECSAMSMKYLGESFDMHTGGVDNMFPHHENEIAQSEAATGKLFCRYWMHSEHLIVEGRKMSKSLGNFHTLRDIFNKGYTGREMRYLLASAHYRQRLNFTFSALDAARASLARIDELTMRLCEAAGVHGLPAVGPGPSPAALPEWAARGWGDFRLAMEEDLNTPKALAALFDMVHAANKAMDAGSMSAASSAGALSVLADIDRVLGFIRTGGTGGPDAAVLALAAQREAARKAMKWTDADALRKRIEAAGWVVQDTPQGPKLKRVS